MARDRTPTSPIGRDAVQAVAVDAATGGRLTVPRGWERLAEDALVLALAEWPPSRGPRPTLRLVAVEVPADADIAEVGLAALAEARTRGQAIAIDVWTGPDDVEGRRVVSAHRLGTGAVAVTEWWFVRDGVATCVRGSCGVDTMNAMTPAFQRALAGFVPADRVPEPPSVEEG